MVQHDPSKMSDDELFANWGDWIKRTADELKEVFEHRFLFNSLCEMFDHNPRLHTQSGQFILEWQARLYGRDVLLFIRREFDYQHGTENILHLLREMQQRPQILSRARYRAFCERLQWADSHAREAYADSFFDTFKIVGDGKSPTDYLDPAGIGEISEALKAGISAVLLYANRNLAHRTPQWNVPDIMVPTDTDFALKAVQECFDRLYPILTGTSMPEPTPSILFDWEESFRYPWMTDDVAEKIRMAEESSRHKRSGDVLSAIKSPPRSSA